MKYSFLFILLFCSEILVLATDEKIKNKASIYLIETEYGNMKIQLFDETPLHKANFEKLVSEGFYDSLLFHRVINHFMIQGGDPNSKNASPEIMLGNGGPGYTIPAEFIDTFLHFKGAIAAARQSDQVNPAKSSSGSQFYIVEGNVINDQVLTQIENQINNGKKQQLAIQLFNDPKNKIIKDKIISFQNQGMQDSLNFYALKINEQVEKNNNWKPFKYSESQRMRYKNFGGTPHLDGAYTVFGQVIEGLDVLDSIAKAKVGSADRPLKDIRMTIKKL